MFYNDKETRDWEERYQETLAKTREFLTHHKEDLDEEVRIIQEDIIPILNKAEKTPEDLAYLKEMYPKIQLLLQSVSDMQFVLGESLSRQSNVFYEHVKKLAAEGNEKAKEVYEDLKPLYDAILQESISPN